MPHCVTTEYLENEVSEGGKNASATAAELLRARAELAKRNKKRPVPVVYFDMDGVLVDFDAYARARGQDLYTRPDPPPEMLVPGFFRNTPVMEGALEAMEIIMALPLDIFIASKPTTKNLCCASEKYQWVEEHFPALLRRMFLTCDKAHLNGDYLVDDDPDRWKGFGGTVIHFDEEHPALSWRAVTDYFVHTYGPNQDDNG